MHVAWHSAARPFSMRHREPSMPDVGTPGARQPAECPEHRPLVSRKDPRIIGSSGFRVGSRPGGRAGDQRGAARRTPRVRRGLPFFTTKVAEVTEAPPTGPVVRRIRGVSARVSFYPRQGGSQGRSQPRSQRRSRVPVSTTVSAHPPPSIAIPRDLTSARRTLVSPPSVRSIAHSNPGRTELLISPRLACWIAYRRNSQVSPIRSCPKLWCGSLRTSRYPACS